MLKVLVVDDEVMVRRGIVLGVDWAARGCVLAGEAANGEEGLEAYRQYHPEVVTMDITMPRMDGIAALEQIKACDSGAKVVMITAAGQQQKIIEALKLGAEKFITKPFESKEVLTVMGSVMK